MQTEYESNQLEPQYIGILEQNNLFQSDQKQIFNQFNNSKNMNNISDDILISSSKIIDDSTHYKAQIGVNYRTHHQEILSFDLFSSGFKTAKNNLIDYDTPSRNEYLGGKMCLSNNIDCAQSKKLIFLNEQSSQKDIQNYGNDVYNSISKLPQDFNETNGNNNIDSQINHPYLICLPKKNLFNDLLYSEQKINDSNINHHGHDKILPIDQTIQNTYNQNSNQNSEQKDKIENICSKIIGGDKYQTSQQPEQLSSNSSSSDNQSKQAIDQIATNKIIAQRNNEKKINPVNSSSTSYNSQYPNYHSSQHSTQAMNVIQSQSQDASRSYCSNNIRYQNKNSYTSHTNGDDSNNPANNSHIYSRYPYYGNLNHIYPHAGTNPNHHSSQIPHHTNILPHYNEYEMEYTEYNDMYVNYYQPSYLSISPDRMDSKKKDGEKSKNTIQQSKQGDKNEQYGKYYQKNGASAYGYQSSNVSGSTAINSQQLFNSNISQPSNSEQKGTIPQDIDSVITIHNSQGSNYTPQEDDYDHTYMRGYYDHKNYYPPPPIYYYPSMNEVYGSHQGSKQIPKRLVNENNELHQLNKQTHKNMQGQGQTKTGSKSDNRQDTYGNQTDSFYHSAYPMHSHKMSGQSMIYCDSSYYKDQSPQQIVSQINYKKPNHSSQQNKENIVSKSNLLSKEILPLIKEKNNVSSKISDKLNKKMLQSKEVNKKVNNQVFNQSQQNEQEENTEYFQHGNQESSQQNCLSLSHEIRKRKRKNNGQLETLKVEYQKGGFWGKDKIQEVAYVTGLSESQVYKWCWDQKKKRLEIFKQKLGNNSVNTETDQQFEDMSGDDEESCKQTGSPEKMIKLNDERGIVPKKTNISKLNNDFTINQLQEKVLTNKNRALQNITDKVLSRQNSKQEYTKMNFKNNNTQKLINNTNKNFDEAISKRQNLENINLDHQQLEDVSKRLHFNQTC